MKKNYNIELEQMILGSIISNNTNYGIICEILDPEHFYKKLHNDMYKAIQNMVAANAHIDQMSLSFFANNHADFLETEDGDLYVEKITKASEKKFGIRQGAEIIKSLYKIRESKKISEKMTEKINKETDYKKVDEHIKQAEEELGNIRHTKILTNTHNIKDLARECDEKIQKIRSGEISSMGLQTKISIIDSVLNGLQKSDLIIIAARPSMGKTAFMLNIAYNIANQGHKVLIISLEMSAPKLILRIASSAINIDLRKLQRGEVSDRELDNLKKFLGIHLPKTPIIVDDSHNLTISSLYSRIKRLKRAEGISCVFVDYLQLLCSQGRDRLAEVTEITKILKCTAKELEIPVVALSQLSRAVESRDDKIPQLSDLRDSGSIEQDADIVMFLYREEYYLWKTKPEDHYSDKFQEWAKKMEKAHNKATIALAKHRDGATGKFEVKFNKETTKFSNLPATKT